MGLTYSGAVAISKLLAGEDTRYLTHTGFEGGSPANTFHNSLGSLIFELFPSGGTARNAFSELGSNILPVQDVFSDSLGSVQLNGSSFYARAWFDVASGPNMWFYEKVPKLVKNSGLIINTDLYVGYTRV